MERLELGPGEDFLRDVLTPEGRIVRQIVSRNPYTGEVYRLTAISDTRYDPATGRPEILTQFLAPTGIDGVLILEPGELSICGEGGEPVSRVHSVVDPFCGRILCFMHSQLVDVGGIPLRVCAQCARALKWEKFKRAVLGFFFRRRE